MKTSLFKKIISTILVLAMAVYFWPATAYAQIASGATETQTTQVVDITDAQINDFISNISVGNVKNKTILSRKQH